MPTTALKALLPQGLLRRRLPDAAGDAVLLTFDDGPTPGVTEGVMDRLEAFDAKGLFFLIGDRVARAPGLACDIVRRGHAVGHHSLNHDAGRWRSPRRWWRDLGRARDLIENATGVPCRFYRAPEGRLSHLTLAGPPLAGLRHVLWSLDSRDWACPDAAAAREIAADVARFVRPRDIVLLHDFAPVAHDLLDALLPRLRDAGLDPAAGLDALAGRSA